ncbi:MAG: phosphoadenosine phosphosulfate reductase family protein [Elusimicrobia bacterium]|nr:phosphoadenosine phosphosulfate reductase family protein [Elusimicrobiota bacterium]
MTENEFLLADRIQKIKSINELYDLENNAYISYSGGKDSTVLSHLIDEALPNNKIPRLYLNTGIEYQMVVSFVERERDARIQIVHSKQNIKSMLEKVGYPFKSKEHSQKVSYYQNSGMGKTVLNYLGQGIKKDFLCPEKLKYNFSPDFKIKVSDKCCYKLKKEVAEKWAKENNRPIKITGMRKEEGGLRTSHNTCTIFEEGNLLKFHPLQPIAEDFIDWYIAEKKIKLCELYYPPYNFKRTGCKGCPFSLDLQEQLDLMSVLLPAEKKQCEIIWKPVYEEYRRIGYRLRKENQPSLFE